MTAFCKNLKRLRLAKHLTQEQAAAALGVSAQSISRWECGTTLPDVTMLPAIARLYCVTIDDLYRETSVAYENYASRLCSAFEASKDPEDFIRADMEYRKLLKSGDYTAEDLRSYGILHQYMMEVSMEKAEELFDRVLKAGPSEDPDIYWRVRRQKGYFLSQVGRNQESIDASLPLVEAGIGELQEWICLIQAYQLAKEYENSFIPSQFDNPANPRAHEATTARELLEETGGIVQGMSGSPIIQNGKLIGAVTHVLIGDPTAGYGIFIENMLRAAE